MPVITGMTATVTWLSEMDFTLGKETKPWVAGHLEPNLQKYL